MPEPFVEPIVFDAAQEAELLPHRVYLRAKCSDPWQLFEDLQASQVEWALAPTIPTAQIGPRVYGRAIVPGSATWQLVAPVGSQARWWVKIEFDTTPVSDHLAGLTWYGILETNANQRHGVHATESGDVVTGEEMWTAYALESLLSREVIRESVYRDRWGNVQRVGIAPPFNEDRTQNRGDHLEFSSQPRGTDDHTWSSRQIVQYLLGVCAPKGSFGAGLPWNLGGDNVIPDDDDPVVEQYGRSVLDVLNEVLSPSRLLGYYVTMADDESAIELRPITFVAADTTIADTTVPANPNQITINLEAARDVSGVSIRETTAGLVDQVIYRGARRRSCCTLSFVDGTLKIGWDPGDQDDYDAGASTGGGYPGSTEVAERRKQNADARQTLSLSSVYRRFCLKPVWDQMPGDGQGGTATFPLFPQDDNIQFNVPGNPRWLRLLPTLPLRDGIDYSDLAEHGPIKNSLGPWDEQPPMVFAPLPSLASAPLIQRRYVQLDKLTAADCVEQTESADARDFSVRVEIPRDDDGVLLHVNGAPQFAIAHEAFVPLDEDEPHGEWDYNEFAVTVCFEDQRYCEGRYPADADLPADRDEYRRKTYYAGDVYRKDWLVGGTIVGLSALTGKPIHAHAGAIRDDSDALVKKAQAAFTYLSIPRRSLSFSCHRVNSAIKLGQYVVSLDSDAKAIGSVVTAISLHIQHGDQVDVAAQSYGTGFVERDQLKL